MQYKHMTGTGLNVSAIALGTAEFGGSCRMEAAYELLDTFAEQGGNLLDTGHVYNDWIPGERSRSEKLLGKWLRDRGMQSKMHVVTKCGHPPINNMAQSRIRRDTIRVDTMESLEFLKVDQLDLLLLHRDDEQIPVSEIVDWLNELVQEGLVRYWGCSNWRTQRIIQANAYASEHGLSSMCCNQAMWSFASIRKEGLNDQTIVPVDREMYEYHFTSGMNLLAYTAQARGYFAKRANNCTLTESSNAVYNLPQNDEKLRFLQNLSEETQLSITELCLLFFSRQPFVSIPVASFKSVEQLKSALCAYTSQAEEQISSTCYPLIF